MKTKFGISKNVFVLGLVSFFNDVASEMIYPLFCFGKKIKGGKIGKNLC